MVYFGNIMTNYRNLKDDEVLRIGFISGKSIIVKPTDKMLISNEDIIIERINGAGRCISIIDTATVENCSLITKKEGDYV